MDALDLDDSRPSYQQVADSLRAAIAAGELAPGDQLATHRALAEEYGVAVETAKRALGQLRTEGLIVTRQGKGSYVRSDAVGGGGRSQEPDLAGQIELLKGELVDIKRRLAALEGLGD